MDLSAYLVSVGIPASLKIVVEEIAKCGIDIGKEVERAALNDLHGKVETSAENSSGDIQAKLDVLSNDIMIKALTDTGQCSLLLSEEDDFAVEVGESGTDKYMVAFDPLDGSSNIDCNCCVGTIFSIYEDQDLSLTLDERVRKPGSEIVCAGYILYGPATELVVTFTGKGVQKFTLDSESGLYIYTGNMDIRNKTKRIYCINEGNSHIWLDDMKEYIAQYRIPEMKYTQRYIGSMVADIHRTILYGGMFCYPADERNMDGKLRLLYECFPMAKIIEEAGGRAIIGKMNTGRILDIIPQKLHQRVPVLLGSMVEIAKYEDALKSVLMQ
jgi:fructose-1,6-bisphosphatase I